MKSASALRQAQVLVALGPTDPELTRLVLANVDSDVGVLLVLDALGLAGPTFPGLDAGGQASAASARWAMTGFPLVGCVECVVAVDAPMVVAADAVPAQEPPAACRRRTQRPPSPSSRFTMAEWSDGCGTTSLVRSSAC